MGKSLKDLLHHIASDAVHNFKDIVAELTDAAKAYQAQSYEECGDKLGMALRRLVVGKTPAPPSPPSPPSPGDSKFCRDHVGCADLHPLDGLCCPVAGGARLACCDQPNAISNMTDLEKRFLEFEISFQKKYASKEERDAKMKAF